MLPFYTSIDFRKFHSQMLKECIIVSLNIAIGWYTIFTPQIESTTSHHITWEETWPSALLLALGHWVRSARKSDGKLNATSLLQFKTKVDAAADYLLSGWSTLQSMTCHLLSYLSPFCFKNNPVQPFKKIKYSNGAYITSWVQFALLSVSLSLTPIRAQGCGSCSQGFET